METPRVGQARFVELFSEVAKRPKTLGEPGFFSVEMHFLSAPGDRNTAIASQDGRTFEPAVTLPERLQSPQFRAIGRIRG